MKIIYDNVYHVSKTRRQVKAKRKQFAIPKHEFLSNRFILKNYYPED